LYRYTSEKTAIDNRNSPAFRGYIRLGAENTVGLCKLNAVDP
jgi:hypothetical protein